MHWQLFLVIREVLGLGEIQLSMLRTSAVIVQGGLEDSFSQRDTPWDCS